MTFSLQDGILTSAEERMTSLSTSGTRAAAYVEDNPGTLEKSDGRMFMISLRNHDEMCTKAADNCTRSKDLLVSVAGLLGRTQQRYDATENDNLVEVDDIFAGLGGASGREDAGLGESGTATTFGTSLPHESLQPPTQAELPEIAWIAFGLGGDLISPTYWTRKIIEWTTGVDPVGWVVEQCSGDWKKVGEAGDAFDKLGDYWTEFGETIRTDAGVLLRGWTGDAANVAEDYFRRLAEAFEGQTAALQELGSTYNSLSIGMLTANQAINNLINMILDLTCGAALLAAAIAVATGSVVGAPAALAMLELLLIDIELIMGLWAQLIFWHGVAMTAVYGVTGLFAGYLSTIHPVEQIEMPNAG
ncbi:hypothetical protein ACQBAR_02005 [Propionibacteriaceae bacterium Y1685]|uniref:hypothetical protein n=1 Tax=Microlunatus sp. Y1700 TaxID=3418487 RepID=UPI003B77DF91